MKSSDFPPLGELVEKIDHLAEEYPDSYSLNEYESAMASELEASKRRGNQFIRFTIHQTQLAIPLKYALEIISTPDITPLPNLPGWILGICNIRGEIIAVVDLAQLLKFEKRRNIGSSHIILLKIGSLKLATVVNGVGGIFFDEDPENEVEERAISDALLSQFARCTYILNEQEIHLLEMTKLMPILRENR